MIATSQLAVDMVNQTNGQILSTMLTFIKVVYANEINTAHTTLLNEATFFICTLITETAKQQAVLYKLVGDDLIVREVITHCLKMLELRGTRDSLVPEVFNTLDILIHSSAEAKTHYFDSQGEEIIQRWDDHKNEQIQRARLEFDKSMQGQPIGMEDPLFQQIFGCYVGTHGTGTTEQVGRSDDDRYFDDEAYEEEEKQEI